MNFFTVDETFNTYAKNRVYARSSKEARELLPRIERGHYPACWGASYDCVTSLHFCEKCLTIAGYFNKCSGAPKPNIFQNRPRIFQEDFAPAHKAKTKQQWLENHVPELISSDH